MTPQIIVPHNLGGSNADLAAANKRLTASKSYKDLSTVIICPTRGGRSLCPRFVSAMLGLMRPMNQQVVGPIFMSGMEVGHAFNAAIEMILANPQLAKFKYVLTIEDDNIPPPDALLKIYEGIDEYDVIGGLYWTKGEGGVPQIWGDPKDHVLNFRPQPPRVGEVVECCGTGMGFNLWRISMFRDPNLRKPWFKTLNGADGGGVGTQDLYAWADFRKNGYRCAVDCRVLVGHWDEANQISW